MFTLSLCLLMLQQKDEGLVAGPAVGATMPSLKIWQIVGEQREKQLDMQADVKSHPALLIFVQSDKWDRPVARILRQLDDAMVEVRKTNAKARIEIVWISKDLDKAKEYLPKAAQSLKLQTSSWNCFPGDIYDAAGWQLSGDGALNLVIIKDGKVSWGRAYAAAREEIVKSTMNAFKAK